jgi:hypothetical protein
MKALFDAAVSFEKNAIGLDGKSAFGGVVEGFKHSLVARLVEHDSSVQGVCFGAFETAGTPTGVRHGDDALILKDVSRLEEFDERGEERGVGFGIFTLHDDATGIRSMLEVSVGGTQFAFGCRRASGFSSVDAGRFGF